MLLWLFRGRWLGSHTRITRSLGIHVADRCGLSCCNRSNAMFKDRSSVIIQEQTASTTRCGGERRSDRSSSRFLWAREITSGRVQLCISESKRGSICIVILTALARKPVVDCKERQKKDLRPRGSSLIVDQGKGLGIEGDAWTKGLCYCSHCRERSNSL